MKSYLLSELSLIKISGNDAKKLLQGQFTYNIDALTELNAQLCAHCNSQGRMISLFYIFLYENNYFLILPKTMVSIAINALKKYAVFYKVSIKDVSEEYTINGRKNLDDIVSKVVNETIYVSLANSKRCFAISTGTILDSISKFYMMSEWKCAEIQSGIPAIYPETSEKFLPHELNLDKLNVISFDKGCYTGQEIIARMHYKGKLKTRMYLATAKNHSVQSGSEVFCIKNNELSSSGMVVDSCQKEYNNQYILFTSDENSIKSNSLFLDKETQIPLILQSGSGNNE